MLFFQETGWRERFSVELLVLCYLTLMFCTQRGDANSELRVCHDASPYLFLLVDFKYKGFACWSLRGSTN
jgi:hypothetical protein